MICYKKKMKKQSLDTIIKENLIILVDRREQNPFSYPKTELTTLHAGDYSFMWKGVDYRDKVIVERKGSISELFELSGSGRERFGREVEKLKTVGVRFILCEFSYADIVNNQPPGALLPQCVYGTLIKLHAVDGLPTIFCGNRVNARNYLYKIFYEWVSYNIIGKDI
jgi:hypothetical protein